nr:DUF4438 domain-containing protein [uncultured Cetobacterium sp.]
MKTNKEQVVKISLQGEIRQPIFAGYKVSSEGVPEILPGTCGITYNFKIGDSCMDISGDHVEPGVSIHHPKDRESKALMNLSCIGNEAKVITGDAKGKKGRVTGKHGGIDNVIIDFPKDVLDDLAIGDKIQIKGYGQGFKLLSHPKISVMNIDPDFFEKIGVKENGGKLEVPVVTRIPAYLMGSGIGVFSASEADYDIMTADKEKNKEFGIDKLRFGDIVLLEDCDNTYGVGYLKGSVTIGVVVHSDCIKSGHGPGVTVIMSCKESLISGIIDKDANIGNYFTR